jgi:hypothetical protein
VGAAALGLALLPLTVPASAAAAHASPGTASGTWTIQPSPSESGAIASALNAVSCVKGGSCTAVGTYTLATGVPRHQFALALQRSGGTWVLKPTPHLKGVGYSLFNGVSCTSANSCIAVGYTVASGNQNASVRPLAERWDGTSWAVDSPPEPAGPHPWAALDGISCPNPSFCLAVGGFFRNETTQQEQPLAEEWNGTTWTQLTAPNPHAENGSEFTSAACVAASQCEAVGDYGFADADLFIIAYRLNGIAWAAQKPVTRPPRWP